MKPIRSLLLTAFALFAAQTAQAGCTSGKSAHLDPEAIVYSATAYWDDEMDEWFVAGPYWDFAGDRAKSGCDDEATELERIVVTAQAMSPPGHPSGFIRMISTPVGGGGHVITRQEIINCRNANTALELAHCTVDDVVGPADGCGSGLSEPIVPDGYIGLDSTAYIFTAACNTHDGCYATPGQLKNVCDLELGNNMREACAEAFDPQNPIFATTNPEELARHRSQCNAQAQLYETGLMQGLPMLTHLTLDILPTSQAAYDEAQHEADCAKKLEEQARWCPR
ncbi:MAG: hypothetical protein HYV17_01790 [Xanthomonadales bacterium]|nr:hypothetical protein [Xanthomonadales bacterium]